VYALPNFVADVLDSNTSDEEREEAMKMIIHLMGDIHNPVHAGFRGDRGGNEIPITILPPPKFPANLHNVWDFHLLVRGNKRRGFVDSIQPPQPADSIMDSLSSLEYNKLKEATIAIAHETSLLVCDAYRHVDEPKAWIQPNDTLEPAYWDKMQPVAFEQIRKAGIRLAKLIDMMAVSTGTSSPQKPVRRPKGEISTDEERSPKHERRQPKGEIWTEEEPSPKHGRRHASNKPRKSARTHPTSNTNQTTRSSYPQGRNHAALILIICMSVIFN
jgi:hypothetical protein